MVELDIERIETGVIDGLIQGGIPAGSVVLVLGDPKSGKTTFQTQFLYTQTVLHGTPGLAILVDMPKREFLENARLFGWDFSPILDEYLYLIDAYSHRIKSAPKFSFTEDVIIDPSNPLQIAKFVKETTTGLISGGYTGQLVGIITSLTPLFFESELIDIYKFLEELKDIAHRHKQVWLIEINTGIERPQVEAMVKAIVDGVIEMRMFEEGRTLRRYIRVYGMRRTPHSLSWFPYEITPTGLALRG
ncbi:RAD55 family ATPase [Thermococcus gammatolerans]|uniref:RecA-superfamily ATPase implicated in signal transduction, putative n=1 Tax=Thermococcus gammatolerans (strain DSM 15229 / JCM 11827 / EJ3) TaxID=593117 RepID=C5A4F6_THEGJ|nr:RecA-superfamily ATPase implicated in signal transduction, putative [Thermococcus gammatolerans EJ3]